MLIIIFFIFLVIFHHNNDQIIVDYVDSSNQIMYDQFVLNLIFYNIVILEL
jgi:hypothetical protein